MHTHNDPVIEREKLAEVRTQRAQAIAAAGCVEEAMATGALPHRIDATLSELIVLGLLRQSVCAYVGVFGHGSTEIGEVLRVYEQAGLVRLYPVRHETEASHAAAALRWVTRKSRSGHFNRPRRPTRPSRFDHTGQRRARRVVSAGR